MSSKRKERTTDVGHQDGDMTIAVSASDCSFDNVTLRNVKLQNVSLKGVRLTNVTLVDVELGVSLDGEESANIGSEVTIPERRRQVSVISLDGSAASPVRESEQDFTSYGGTSTDGSLPVTPSPTREPAVSSEQRSLASPNLTGLSAFGVNESDRDESGQDDSASDDDTSTEKSMSVPASATSEAAVSTEQRSPASPGLSRANETSNTVPPSLHASSSLPSHRICKAPGPYHKGQGDCLYIRDLHHQDVDLSQYRGTRYELQYYKNTETKLSWNRTTYVVESEFDKDQHLNRCRDAVTLYPSQYRTIYCYGSPQSLLAFLHDSRDLLQEIRRLRLQFNVRERGSYSVGPLSAVTAQVPLRHLLNLLAQNCLHLECFDLAISSTFFKSMRITGQTTAQQFFGSKPIDLRTAADRSGNGAHEERNFLQHLARVPRLDLHFPIVDQKRFTRQRTDFIISLSRLIEAQMPEPRPIVQPPQCACRADVLLEESCFWNLGE